MGRERSDEALRANLFQFARRARGFPKFDGVVRYDVSILAPATAGGGLIDADSQTLRRGVASDHRGHVRLANARIITGDEQSNGYPHINNYATMIWRTC